MRAKTRKNKTEKGCIRAKFSVAPPEEMMRIVILMVWPMQQSPIRQLPYWLEVTQVEVSMRTKRA